MGCVSRQVICGLPAHPLGIVCTGAAAKVWAMKTGCLGRPQMSCLLTQQMSCLLTQTGWVGRLPRNYPGVIPELFRNYPGIIAELSWSGRAESAVSLKESLTLGIGIVPEFSPELSLELSQNYRGGAVSVLQLRASLNTRRRPG